MTRSSLARRAGISAFALALGFALAPVAMADDYTASPSQTQASQGSQQAAPENGEGEAVGGNGTTLPGQPNDGDY